jgi:hypothetical protein
MPEFGLNLEGEELQRYLEIEAARDKNIAEGILPSTPKNSFVGFDPKFARFSVSFKNLKEGRQRGRPRGRLRGRGRPRGRKRQKQNHEQKFNKQSDINSEVTMSFYTIHTAAKKWGTNWQTVAAFKRSGVIPASEFYENGRIKADFVETCSFDKLQEQHRALHKYSCRRRKRLTPQESETVHEERNTEHKTVREENKVLPEQPRTQSLIETQFIDFIKSITSSVSQGNYKLKNWSVKNRASIDVITIELEKSVT